MKPQQQAHVGAVHADQDRTPLARAEQQQRIVQQPAAIVPASVQAAALGATMSVAAIVPSNVAIAARFRAVPGCDGSSSPALIASSAQATALCSTGRASMQAITASGSFPRSR